MPKKCKVTTQKEAYEEKESNKEENDWYQTQSVQVSLDRDITIDCNLKGVKERAMFTKEEELPKGHGR